MRRVWASVSVFVSSIRLLWRCKGAVVWVSSTPMPRLQLLLMRVRVPGAIRQLLWWFIRLAGTGIKVDCQLPNVCILLHRHLPKLYKETTLNRRHACNARLLYMRPTKEASIFTLKD
jgi:hypothetical protein